MAFKASYVVGNFATTETTLSQELVAQFFRTVTTPSSSSWYVSVPLVENLSTVTVKNYNGITSAGVDALSVFPYNLLFSYRSSRRDPSRFSKGAFAYTQIADRTDNRVCGFYNHDTRRWIIWLAKAFPIGDDYGTTLENKFCVCDNDGTIARTVSGYRPPYSFLSDNRSDYTYCVVRTASGYVLDYVRITDYSTTVDSIVGIMPNNTVLAEAIGYYLNNVYDNTSEWFTDGGKREYSIYYFDKDTVANNTDMSQYFNWSSKRNIGTIRLTTMKVQETPRIPPQWASTPREPYNLDERPSNSATILLSYLSDTIGDFVPAYLKKFVSLIKQYYVDSYSDGNGSNRYTTTLSMLKGIGLGLEELPNVYGTMLPDLPPSNQYSHSMFAIASPASDKYLGYEVVAYPANLQYRINAQSLSILEKDSPTPSGYVPNQHTLLPWSCSLRNEQIAEVYVPMTLGESISKPANIWVGMNQSLHGLSVYLYVSSFDVLYDSATYSSGAPYRFWSSGITPGGIDPYAPGGDSGEGGGGGTFDDTSDAIPDPDLPNISILGTGLIRVFVPTAAELSGLSNYLWSNAFSVDSIKKLFANPMDMIISLGILPFQVPQSTSTVAVKFASQTTNVSMHQAVNQYVKIECGSYDLREYFGSALDYSPYTKAFLYLPYVGAIPLDPDIFTRRTIGVAYTVDIFSGSFSCRVLGDGNVIYHQTGNMLTPLPIAGSDYSRMWGNLFAIGGSVALSAIAGGIWAGAGLGVQAATAGGTVSGVMSTLQTPSIGASLMRGGPLATGAFAGAESKLSEMINSAAKAGTSEKVARAAFGASAVNVGRNVAGGIVGSKPEIALSGSFGPTSGLLDVQYPYLITVRPNQSLADDYKHFLGYPSNITRTVGECSGYTVFEQVELKGIPATDEEMAQITALLKGGVYV